MLTKDEILFIGKVFESLAFKIGQSKEVQVAEVILHKLQQQLQEQEQEV